MARRDVLYLLCLLFFISISVNYSGCTYYSNHYDQHGLMEERFCHLLGKKSTIEITNFAAVVRHKHMFDRWTVNTNVHCKFIFKAPKGVGLFGVIQKMSFRRNGTQCLDYVQFKRKDNYWTGKFCGSFDQSKTKIEPHVEPENIYPSGLVLPRSMYAEYDPSERKSGGELETEIFISKERLQNEEHLDLSIVYTPYKNCSDVELKKYTSIGHNTCLQNEFFCDGIYNCVPNICSDEDNCPNNTNEIVSTGTGTKVTISALTTLILCSVIFAICIWICKRSHKLCWSLDCTESNVCSTRPGPISREAEGSVNSPVSSAPMLEVAVSPSVADKDLPPSYDSLFPEHSNPARS